MLSQQWCALSDPGAEEAARDRLSFRRSCGVPLDEETPDHSSIWGFRQRIDELGLSEKLLAEVNRQLDARGLILGSSPRTKRGALVDATAISAAVKRPAFEDGQVDPRDPDANDQPPSRRRRQPSPSSVRRDGDEHETDEGSARCGAARPRRDVRQEVERPGEMSG